MERTKMVVSAGMCCYNSVAFEERTGTHEPHIQLPLYGGVVMMSDVAHQLRQQYIVRLQCALDDYRQAFGEQLCIALVECTIEQNAFRL